MRPHDGGINYSLAVPAFSEHQGLFARGLTDMRFTCAATIAPFHGRASTAQ